MKYKIQFDLICPESDDDGDILSPEGYDKDSVYEVIHSGTFDNNWKLKNFKIKESK
tara:strand:+ start:1835 stop:2002 length:168 start_codon:yes stop_codon:yes gene_type:complete